MRLIVLLSVVLAGCWYGKTPTAVTTPAPATAPAPTAAADRDADEPSYRSTTIAADTIGVATMTAGLIGLERGADENVSGALLVTGMAIAGFADPIVHLVHGRGSRALASYLIRAVTTSTGAMMGVATSNCRDELFCGLDGMLWGTAAGLAIAGVADAFLLHGDLSSHTWTPTVTASDGGARVGIIAPL